MNSDLLGLPAVFIIGLVFGIGPCTITCLPYLGPVFLSGDGGIKDSWKIILPFSMGRMSSYTALGAISGYIGASVEKTLYTPVVGWVLGGATVAVGLLIFWRSFDKNSACGGHQSRLLRNNPLLPSGLFFMGVGMAATPCTPLTIVMLTSASTASVFSGFLLGFCFGVGAVLVPAIVFGFGMAYFGQRIRQIIHSWRTALERASACLLIILGIGVMTG